MISVVIAIVILLHFKSWPLLYSFRYFPVIVPILWHSWLKSRKFRTPFASTATRLITDEIHQSYIVGLDDLDINLHMNNSYFDTIHQFTLPVDHITNTLIMQE